MFSFGTYYLRKDALRLALQNVFKNSNIRSIDSAQLYKNEGQIGEFLSEQNITSPITVTTKIQENKLRNIDLIIKCIKESVKKINPSSNNHIKIRVLLHHPSSFHVQKALEECVKLQIIHEIGVSNHNIFDLQTLLKNSTIRPCVNQLELHPLLDPNELQPLLAFCNNNNIPVQGHTILMRGLYQTQKEILEAASNANLTQAQYFVAWAASQIGVKNICISSTSKEHFQELLSTPIPSEPLQSLNVKRHRLYPFLNVTDNYRYDSEQTTEALCKTILREIDIVKNNTLNNDMMSDLSLMLPSIKSCWSNVSKDIARLAYPNLTDEQRFSRLNDLSKAIRIYCYDRYQSKSKKERKLTLSCVRNKRSNDDVISDAVINPTPMPVDVSRKETLEPFFNYVASDDIFVGDKEFFKGAIIDKRMDMCKQVTGPDHIEALCKAVSQNSQIRHFLLGNNIAFKYNQEKAQAIADIIRSNQQIETWYLAGNYIGPRAVEIISNALEVNTTCKSLWLKRNPILPEGCKYIRKMLYINQTLTLLDLDNCGLLDSGVATLFSPVDDSKNTFYFSSLQHIYLDANGITVQGATHMSQQLLKHKHKIKSLYISINRLGDEGAKIICNSLEGSNSLKRFSMGSNRLTDNVGDFIVDFALSCKRLITFNLGCYKSTFDMGEKPNFFTNVEPFMRLLDHPSLQYLDLLMNNIPNEDILRLIEEAKIKKPQIIIFGSQITTKPQDRAQLKYNGNFNGEIIDPTVFKFVKHPKAVLHIDSIYRNAM